MTKRKIIAIFACLAFVLAAFSCTTMTVTKEGSLAGMYRIYNDQYDDYQRMAANPATTEAQKKIMREKKPILDSLQKLLPAYDAAVITGTATADQRQEIMDLLNELSKL